MAWVEFIQEPQVGRKTMTWKVVTTTARGDVPEHLGYIRWYSPWRQFCFYPAPRTIWNPACLDEVTAFIRTKMAERRG